jgi:glycosyltransferase involved in cell wall biosynthesis
VKIALLAEGDPESMVASFSGLTKSLLDALRRRGHEVFTGDADLYGWRRVLAAAPSWSPNRKRWSVRYHALSWPRSLRSARASSIVARLPQVDAVLQVGATFRISDKVRRGRPYFTFCDSNIAMATRGRGTGSSWASVLTPRELHNLHAAEAEVYRGAAGIFPLSRVLGDSFVSDFGIPSNKVHVTGAGPNFPPTASLPERPAVRNGPPTVLFVGVDFDRKGGQNVLEAFARLRRDIPDARLLLVGPRFPIDAPGVDNLGFLRKDDPSDWRRLEQAYNDADVFCLPTRYEPFGVAFIEAMFFGLPCIGTNVWAVPEMIVHEQTGLLVPPDSPDDLRSALHRLLSDRELSSRMGAAGRERALTQFTWDAVARRVSDAMEAAVIGAG